MLELRGVEACGVRVSVPFPFMLLSRLGSRRSGEREPSTLPSASTLDEAVGETDKLGDHPIKQPALSGSGFVGGTSTSASCQTRERVTVSFSLSRKSFLVTCTVIFAAPFGRYFGPRSASTSSAIMCQNDSRTAPRII